VWRADLRNRCCPSQSGPLCLFSLSCADPSLFQRSILFSVEATSRFVDTLDFARPATTLQAFPRFSVVSCCSIFHSTCDCNPRFSVDHAEYLLVGDLSPYGENLNWRTRRRVFGYPGGPAGFCVSRSFSVFPEAHPHLAVFRHGLHPPPRNLTGLHLTQHS